MISLHGNGVLTCFSVPLAQGSISSEIQEEAPFSEIQEMMMDLNKSTDLFILQIIIFYISNIKIDNNEMT